MSDPVIPDWGKVVEKHAERIFRIAYRILGSVHDAEDVSQEVFTEAMAVHRSGPIRTWTGLMVRLSTVRSIDRLRRNQGRPEPLPVYFTNPKTTVTEAGLKSLQDLPSLRTLYVGYHGKWTLPIDRLRELLPSVDVRSPTEGLRP